MPKPRVYVEATIPNFYYDRRTDPAMVSRRVCTREWWERAGHEYELVTGAPVLAELLAGITPRVSPRLLLVSSLPIFLPDDPVDETVRVYVQHKLMPSKPLEDAQHVAIASHNHCDFIVTWNCRHLANPNKARHLAKINSMLGLHVPAIVTPRDLLGRQG